MNDLTFKERMIFELEKDDFVKGSKITTNLWIKRYNITKSEACKIYRMVVNYHIEKYGEVKNNYSHDHEREYHKNFIERTPRKRRNKQINQNQQRELKKFERRNEK